MSHLETTADLHRSVMALWEGVETIFKATSQAVAMAADVKTSEEDSALMMVAGAPSDEGPAAAASACTAEIVRMLNDQALLDLPMHLEDLPLEVSAEALSVDVGRVHAGSKFLVAGMLASLALQQQLQQQLRRLRWNAETNDATKLALPTSFSGDSLHKLPPEPQAEANPPPPKVEPNEYGHPQSRLDSQETVSVPTAIGQDSRSSIAESANSAYDSDARRLSPEPGSLSSRYSVVQTPSDRSVSQCSAEEDGRSDHSEASAQVLSSRTLSSASRAELDAGGRNRTADDDTAGKSVECDDAKSMRPVEVDEALERAGAMEVRVF